MTTSKSQVRVTTRGDVPAAASAYAEQKVTGVQHYTAAPVLDAHVVLTQHADPARRHPAIADAHLDLGTVQLHAEGEAEDLVAAIDLAVERLHRELVDRQERRRTRRRRAGTPRP